MKKNIFNCLLVLWICTSCVQKFHAKYIIPKDLPKEVPEMVLTDGVHLTKKASGSAVDTSALFDYSTPGFLISKHEITNQQFCQFLNVDSIRNNKKLVKTIIDLNHKESKIFLTEDNVYTSVKGFEKYPVVLVSWWGATKYCEWLSEFVNKQRGENGLFQLPKYRLPSEYEWVSATTNKFELSYFIVTMCDSAGFYSDTSTVSARKISKDKANVYGIGGMDDNVYEWTQDDFYPMEKVMDFSMMTTSYYEAPKAEALVRKHGMEGRNSCGRVSRLRDHFYSDTGFRIVQTVFGRATGADF